MKEDLTEQRSPIEELINLWMHQRPSDEGDGEIIVNWYEFNGFLSELLEADKAHREKYKHTKEDVLKFGEVCLLDGYEHCKLEHGLRSNFKIDSFRLPLLAQKTYKEQHEQK